MTSRHDANPITPHTQTPRATALNGGAMNSVALSGQMILVCFSVNSLGNCIVV